MRNAGTSIHTTLFVLSICLGLAGFTASADAQTSGDQTDKTPAPPAQSSVVAPTASEPKYASAWLDDRVVKHLGKPADRLSFKVTNKTKDPIKYDFNTGQQYDIVVTDANGKEVWTWSKNQTFSSLITHLNLRPGHTETYTAMWDRRDDNQSPVPPGVYTATATLQTLPRLAVSQATTVDVNRQDQDPTNVGLQSAPGALRDPNAPENGNEVQHDTSPSVSAKTTIMVGDIVNLEPRPVINPLAPWQSKTSIPPSGTIEM